MGERFVAEMCQGSLESRAGERSDADMLQGSLESLTTGSSDAEGGAGGGVFCLGTTGSGMKDLRCKAVSVTRREWSSLSPVSK